MSRKSGWHRCMTQDANPNNLRRKSRKVRQGTGSSDNIPKSGKATDGPASMREFYRRKRAGNLRRGNPDTVYRPALQRWNGNDPTKRDYDK